MLTDEKAFTCHEDCQTSFFRSLGTVELTDITAVSTEAGKEYCILVSVVLRDQPARGWAKDRNGNARPLSWCLGVCSGQQAVPASLGPLF